MRKTVITPCWKRSPVIGSGCVDPEFLDLDTVKKRIDRLASNGDLPQYMKERYLGAR